MKRWYSDYPRELLSNEQMAEADRLAVAMGVPSLALMENAGQAVADEAVRMVRSASDGHLTAQAPDVATARSDGHLTAHAPDVATARCDGHLTAHAPDVATARSDGHPKAHAPDVATARSDGHPKAQKRITILCGPGNNGGDGFVAARLLQERGYAVSVYLLGDVARLNGDAAENAKRWLEIGQIAPFPENVRLEPSGPEPTPAYMRMCETCQSAVGDADLVIDAVFGAGLDRPLPEVVAAMFTACGRAGVPVLSVDVPTGIVGTTGEPPPGNGATTAIAGATVTFFRLKPAHVSGTGRQRCGRVVLADIGIPEAVIASIRSKPLGVLRLEINRVDAPSLRHICPTPDAHKYTRGHAVILSGPATRTGAARLAARAALRVGAGLVTVASPTDALTVNAAQLTAIMLQPCDDAAQLAAMLEDERKNAIVVGPGCGVGATTAAMVEAAMKSKSGVVLDADALTTIAQDVERFTQATRRRIPDGSGLPTYDHRTVLTPHDGESARLFPDLADLPSRIERARQAASRIGCVVVLKGNTTIIAAPLTDGGEGEFEHQRLALNTNAPPWLATAGSGDVLAGLIAGLMAQGLDAFHAACAGVWIHGDAAVRLGPGLIAEDLPEMLPAVLRDLYGTWEEGR